VDEIAAITDECRLDVVQLHGSEDAEFCRTVRRALDRPTVKAFEVEVWADLETISNFVVEEVDAFLIDRRRRRSDPEAPSRDQGEGETAAACADEMACAEEIMFHWLVAAEAKKLGKPLFLAGGLTPVNVSAAIGKVRPFGVDVSSGVETAPGKKSREKIVLFVDRVNGGV
jgi:phosphoribosylanthranilate isomerase